MRTDNAMQRLRAADPALELEPADAAARDALRRAVVAAPAAPSALDRRMRRRRLIPVLAALALAAVAAAGAGAWAFGQRAAESTSVTCLFEPNATTGLGSSSGDPVADCRAEWHRMFDGEPPAFVAYDSRGDVVVVRAGMPVPDDWKQLPDSFRQDARLIEVEQRLGDSAAGLDSGCFSLAEARPLAERALRKTGLEGWTVVREPGVEERAGWCTAYRVDRAARRVVLTSHTGAFRDLDAPHMALARRLGDAAARECLTAKAATELVRREAARFGWKESDSSLILNSLGGDGCADVVVNVGGRVVVTIRGGRP